MSRHPRLGIWICVVIGLGVAIVFLPGVVGAAETATADSNVTMDTEVADADGETRVLVELSEPSSPNGSVSSEQYISHRQTQTDHSQADLLQLANRTEGVHVERQFWIINAIGITINTTTVDPAVLAEADNVEHISAEVTVERHTGSTASERQPVTDFSPTFSHGPATATTLSESTTWGVSRVGAPAVWNRFDNKGAGTRVAVLDTGVNESHPDIELTDDGWRDFVHGDDTPSDVDGHGTHVSGTVAGGNARGEWIGVAPETELMHGKVLDDDGSGSAFDILAGIEWAVEEDADVVSMSLGTSGTTDIFIDAVDNANQAGTVPVASIGNDGAGTSGSPGNYYSTIGVGAVNSTDGVADFSGGTVHDTDDDWNDPPSDWPESFVVPSVTAPGVGVTSAWTEGGYVQFSGTSMAAPHVAGSVALLQANTDDELSPAETQTLLEEHADVPPEAPESKDTRYGAGIVNIDETLLEYLDGDLALTDSDIPTTAPRGHSITATATVTNTGDGRDAATLTYVVDGEVVNETRVELDPGEEASVPLAYDVPEDAPLGNVTSQLTYDGETHQVETTVVRPASFEATDATAPTVVATSESYTVDAGITNTGDIEGTQTVSIEIGDADDDVWTTLQTTNLTLGPNETHELTEHVTIPATQSTGHQEIAVRTDDTVATTTTFVATETGTLDGTVTDAVTDDPRTNATVTATRQSDGATFTTTVDSSGSYTQSVAAGEYDIVAVADGFHPADATDVSIGANETVSEDFALEPRAATVTAVVSDGTSGDPIENATVGINTTDPTVTGTTNATGETTLQVERGTYTVNASAAGYVETNATITLTAGDTQTVPLTLDRRDGTLTGTVSASDTTDPVPNATIMVTHPDSETPWETQTDAAGAYSLELPAATGYTVTVKKEGYTETTASVDIGLGETVTQEYDLDPRPATVTGTITDATSDWSVTDATVTLTNETEHPVATTTTADGAYSLTVPRGAYTHTVDHPAYDTATTSVDLGRNESLTQSVALDRTPTFYEITDLDTPSTVVEGDDVTATATVTNTGSENATWELVMQLNESEISTQQLTIPPNTTEQRTLTGTANASPGDHTLTITTIAQTVTSDIQVESDAADDTGGESGGGSVGGGPVGGSDTDAGDDDADVVPPDPPAAIDIEAEETATLITDEETGQSTATFSEESAVASVSFTAPADGSINARTLTTEPDKTGPSPGASARVARITVGDDLADSAATIRMRVTQTRLEEIDADAEDLRLNRYDTANGEWEGLETELIDETDDRVIVNAETPGFSYFSVSAVSSPTAAFDAPAEVAAGDELTVDASASTDRYGEIVSYDWTVGDEHHSGETISPTLADPGDVTVELTVTNDAGQTDTTAATVTVTQTDAGPSDDSADSDSPVGVADDTEADTPGFGVVVALLALLLAAGLLTRRR